MKKYTAFFVCSLVALLASRLAEASSIIPAAQVQTLPHNTSIVLRGNIIFGHGGGRYLFRDSSGDIVVKIDDDKWNGLYVSQFDRVEIDGQLKRDERNGHIEVEVRTIRRAAGNALPREMYVTAAAGLIQRAAPSTNSARRGAYTFGQRVTVIEQGPRATIDGVSNHWYKTRQNVWVFGGFLSEAIPSQRAAGSQERRAAEPQNMFIWPVTGRITSPYGNRRSPTTGRMQFHGGIDIGAPSGTPVRAAMSGRVSRVGRNNVFGNYIIINHHSGLQTKYAHLSRVRVNQGANVATGERIGDVGRTGISTGPHLHFEVIRNGITVNPRELLR